MQQQINFLDLLCGKTSWEHSAQTEEKISASSSRSFAKSKTDPPQFLDLRGGGNAHWNSSGYVLGNGYSLAWRVFDAQFWGVPQRRRRIYLVVDFGGERAAEILFKREGLQRSFAEVSKSWKREKSSDHLEARPHIARETYDARGNGNGTIANTLTGDHERRITDYSVPVCGALVYPNIAKTLTAEADGSPCIDGRGAQIVVIGFDPSECARLQGMPDDWDADAGGSDAARYKMWGNGMALPNVLYVFEGFAEFNEEKKIA